MRGISNDNPFNAFNVKPWSCSSFFLWICIEACSCCSLNLRSFIFSCSCFSLSSRSSTFFLLISSCRLFTAVARSDGSSTFVFTTYTLIPVLLFFVHPLTQTLLSPRTFFPSEQRHPVPFSRYLACALNFSSCLCLFLNTASAWIFFLSWVVFSMFSWIAALEVPVLKISLTKINRTCFFWDGVRS